MASQRISCYCGPPMAPMLEIMTTPTIPATIPISRLPSGNSASGLAACVAGVLGAWCVHRLVGAIPMLTAALLLGIVAVNAGLLPEATRAGTRFAAGSLMRAGVVLLGLQVAVGDIAGL